MSVKVTDHGFDDLLERAIALSGGLEAGVLGDKAAQPHPNSKLTVGELAAVHEVGAGGVPPRSVVRDYVDEKQLDVAAKGVALARAVLAGRSTVAEFREELGAFVVEGMKQHLDEGIPPPLYPETINDKRRQGPPVPLEDTMTIREAIDFRWRGEKG